ncbi:fumarylacetoacetate hydrolase family protein [Agromyces sp. NPDC058064]|uniref:fumarylacetoacetate hydrolase family protein n=1 Tax=Agromyces sp. NPDC058064 TaxID=3346322 RepID=UPI0036DC1CC9
MELLRLGEPGSEAPVVRHDGRFHRLDPLTRDIDGAFLAADGIARTRAALAAGELPELEGADALRIGAPIARPTAVLCIGQNYAAHAAESGDAPPTVPILFYKHPNTVVGPFDDVAVPPGAEQVDWEIELGVVIGKRARYLASPAEALEHVAGYVTSNDVSEREFQVARSGGQWSKGKSSETFNPLGPALVPADEVDPQNLRLWSAVNGEPRQDSNTADMIFSVAEIIHHLSQYLVLEPGDLINTGTPQGVALSGRFPYLSAGDVMEVGIDGIGAQRQRLVPARV